MTLRRILVGTLLLAAWASDARAENWPQWRGPLFSGSTTEKNLPESCDKANLAWAADLPGHSAATPIVWGDRVFVSATDPESKGVLAMCLGAADGKVLWRKRLGDNGRAPSNDMASPSAVTDGRLVCFLTGGGDLAGFDFGGNLLWSRNVEREFGNFCIKYGYSSSPLLYGGRLYVQALRRPKPHYGEPGVSEPLTPYLLAVDPATGKDIFRYIRNSDADDESFEAYTTPMPHQAGGRAEIVLVGGDYVTGHDPATGREFWRFGYNPSRRGMWRLIPGTVAWQDLIFFIQPRGNPMMAVKAGGAGTLAKDAAAWTFDGKTSDSATPLVYGDALYVLGSDSKVMTCLDPRTGRERWHGSLPGSSAYRASPTGADGRIWCMSEAGEVVVLAAGNEFKILSRTSLGDGPTQATIAAANGHIYIRTAKRLHCFGKPPAKP